jgi:hypothetical protein
MQILGAWISSEIVFNVFISLPAGVKIGYMKYILGGKIYVRRMREHI